MIHSFRSALVLSFMLLLAGCADGPNNSAGLTSAKPQPKRTWSTESKRWRYPHEAGGSFANQGIETLSIYQTSTPDSFYDVCKYYESAGEIKGLADFATADPTAGGWSSEETLSSQKVVWVVAGNDDGKLPKKQAVNDRSFMIRMPDYSVTAFLRQEPSDKNTRITLIFEAK